MHTLIRVGKTIIGIIEQANPIEMMPPTIIILYYLKQRIIIPIPVLKTGASGMIAYRLHCKDLSFQYLQVTTNINLQYMQGTEKCKHPTLQPQKHHQPHCHH